MMAEAASPVIAGTVLGIVMLVMMMAIVVAIMAARNLLVAVILMSAFSLASAVWLLAMDAVDVSFTEAVVGSGVSTLITLGAILLTRSEARPVPWQALIAPSLVTLVVGGLLIYASFDLPNLGDAMSPANAYVGRMYLEQAAHDIGSPNVVTAVLSSYRGFDTLGETTVIFAAGVGVALMLGFGERALQDAHRSIAPLWVEGDHHVVLRVAAKLLIPLIAIYAFYVQFHGDLGPGGGFQAGVIMAVAIILHALVFGLHVTMKAIPPQLTRGLAAIGVLIYAGVGVANMINGGAFLDYDHLFPPRFEARLPDSSLAGGHHIWGQHFGIMGIELGVFLTVAATMVTIFYAFAGRAPDPVGAPQAEDD
ncbi:MAG: Na(+)/H(+) antiporter subunit B [Alphaproteobacteria bacterium]